MSRRLGRTKILGEVEVYQGRDHTLRVTIKTDVGDITGAKLWFAVKESADVDDAQAAILKRSANAGGSDAEAKVVDGQNRVVEFYISRDDTPGMTEGDYIADAAIELPTGKRLQLLQPLRFVVIQPVVRTF